MKTTFRIFFAALIVTASSMAQAQIFTGTSLTPEERKKSKETREIWWSKMQESRVEVITTESQPFKKGQAKGKLSLSMKQHFNAQGQPIEYENYFGNGKLGHIYQYVYDEQGNTKAFTMSNRKGKQISRTENDFTENTLTTSRKYKGKKARYASRVEYAYDASGRLIESKTINPRKEKLVSRSQCTYNEDGSKSRIEKFNRKGKLVSATDYSCDAEGKTFASSKAELRTVCERFEQNADGKTIKIVETIDADKNGARSITKYDEHNYLLERIDYDEAGEIKLQFVYTYNDAGYMLTSELRRRGGRLDFRADFERDANGLAISEVHQNGKGEIVRKLRYSYSFY
jgi:YD repeat-containing protein